MPKIPEAKDEPNLDNIDRPIRKPKLLAVIVGVNRYQDIDIENLSFCANDAVGLAAALKKAALQKVADKEAIFETVDIRVHCDLDFADLTISPDLPPSSLSSIIPPKTEQILASLEIFSQAQPEDTVLFYFSGHGDYDEKTEQTILCVPEIEKANLTQTGLLIETVLAKITASAAKQQLIWLDACHSGGMASQLIEAILQETKNNPNIYGITACDRDEESSEVRELQHGLFTYNLIRGLEGGLSSPEINIDELYQYVYYQTLEYIDRTNQLSQMVSRTSDPIVNPFHPQRFAFGSGQFIIGYSSSQSANNNIRGALVFNGATPSPAAIDLSRILASKGGFTEQFYPNKDESIQDSISALLRSPNTTTALLYLKGKFEVSNLGTVFFIFDDGTEISREWLAQELADSSVEQQIIILDCCQTANVKRQIEILKQSNKSQCIVAASTENNWLEEKFRQIIKNNSLKGLTGTNLINQFTQAFSARGIFNSQQRHFHRSAPQGKVIDVILPQAQQLNTAVVDRNYCPYKGLAAFTKEDRDFFFGRSDTTQKIIRQLETSSFLPVVGASGSGKSSVVQAGVVPQLLDRGLFIPEVNLNKPCQVWILRPGENPFQSLALALSNENHDSDYIEGVLNLGVKSFVAWLRQQTLPMGVLVIDQFEELFTQTSEVQRSLFLDLILGAVEYAGDRFKIIITLRNDFMASCLSIPNLGERVKQNPIFVLSYLTETEYRQIINAPATRVGLLVQPELVDVLISEVSQEKGSLPLLEFTLEQLWLNRDRGLLSLQVYKNKIGGLKKVLQERADGVYQKLNEDQKQCAEWIFTQLVSLGEGQADTRRRRVLSELVVPKYDQDLITSTLNILRDSRLIVMSNQDGDVISSQPVKVSTKGKDKEETPQPLQLSIDSEVTVEIAHEILIRNWQQLHWWLDENREQIRLRERIEEKATEWKINGQKTDYLIRGAALAQAEEFYIKSADELSAKSQEFIYQSIEDRDKQAKLVKRRRRQTIGVLTGGIVTLSMVAGAALWQLKKATISEINALNNSAEALLASNQELDALVTGLKAGKKIKNSRLGVDLETKINTLGNLQNVFYKVKEFNRLENHPYEVNSVAIDPNSQLIISASGNSLPKINSSEIKLWNREGKLLHTLSGHTNFVRQVVFSPDGKLMASAAGDGAVKLWSREGKLLHTFKNSSPSQIAISPNSQLLAFDDQKKVKLWSREGKLLHTLSGHTDDIYSVAISPDGQFLASASRDKTIKLWSKEGRLLHTLTGQTDHVYQILFSPDGQFLASASRDRTVKLWNKEGRLLHTLTENSSEHSKNIAISPNSQLIAVSTENHTIELWNREGKLISTLHGHGGNNYDSNGITALEFSSSGQFLVSASVDQTVKLWNLQKDILYALPNTPSTEVLFFGAISSDSQLIAYQDDRATIKLFTKEGKLKSILQGHTRPLRHVAFSPDGEYIVSASLDNTAKLWDREGKLLHTLSGHADEVFFVVISPNSEKIVSASFDNTMKLWDREGKLLHTLSGHTSFINRVLFTSDGKYIVSASADGTVKLWNNYGTLLRTFEGHTDNVRDIAISPNGKRIVSASFDKTMKLWNKYGESLNTLTGHTDQVRRVLFSSDGKYIVSASADNTVKLWNKDGTLLRTLRGHTNNIYSLAISSDSQIIASGSEDGTIKLWSKGGKLLTTMKGHTTGVYQIVFSPDTSFLFSASHKNDEVKLWSLNLDDVLERACDWTKDYLTNNPNLSQEDKENCNNILDF